MNKVGDVLGKSVFMIGGIVAIVAILALAVEVQGATIYVDPTDANAYSTIQDAIDNASAGDTIVVNASTYVENLTVNKLNLAIIGENTPFDGASIVNGTIDVIADGVTIKWLKVQPGDVTGKEAGIAVYANNVTVDGNIICNMTGDGNGTIKGIYAYSINGIENISIINNYIHNINNTNSSGHNGGADGICIQGNVINVTVNGNVIEDIHSAGWAYGVEITPTNFTGYPSPKNVSVTENTISKINDGSVYDVWADTFSAPYPGSCVGIDEFENSTVEEPANASEVDVHYNNFYNPVGIVNKDLNHVLNATFNYWNASDGPHGVYLTLDGYANMTDPYTNRWANGSGAVFTTDKGQTADEYSINNTHFDPWLSGPWYKFGLVHDITNDTYWGGIQDAVYTASDGDTIKVYPGLYRENVVINKPLKIIGDPYLDANGSIGISIEANNTLVENMTIYNGSIGIYVHNDSFTIQNVIINNCTIYNCTYSEAIGIKFENVTDSKIQNSYVHNNGYNISISYGNGGGIYLYDSTFNIIENNTCDSNVYDEIYLNNSHYNIINNNTFQNDVEYEAIWLDGSSYNNITNNTIRWNAYDGIFMNDAWHNFVYNNTIYENGEGGEEGGEEGGISIWENCSYNIIRENKIFNNTYNGTNFWGGHPISMNNILEGNEIYNNTGGIYLNSSINNAIINNRLSNTDWDLNITNATGNTFAGNTVASYPTTFDINGYYGNFTISGVDEPPDEPEGFANISKFLEIGGDGWMNLTIYYDPEFVSVNESTLHVWKHNDTGWYHHDWCSYQGVDAINDAITVNFTLSDPPVYAPLQDVAAPTTEISPGTPNYDNVWINSSTPITLIATDNDNGSGVNKTYYRIWNGSWSAWMEYTSPFHLLKEGINYVEYYSTDNAGNIEDVNNRTFCVDNSPPDLTIEYGQPLYNDSVNNYITKDTPIYINATDVPKEPAKLNGTNFTWVFPSISSSNIVWTIKNFADSDIHIYVWTNCSRSIIPLNSLLWNGASWLYVPPDITVGSHSQTTYNIPIQTGTRACLIRYNISWNGGEEFARVIAEAIVYNNSGTWQINYTLISFDILNNYSIPVNDFELELYNSSSNPITPDDIYAYYHGWWAPPEINNMSTGIELIWRGEPIEANQSMHFGLNISKDVDSSVLSGVRYNWTVHCGVGSYEIYYHIWNGTEWSAWYAEARNESVVFNLSSKGYTNSGKYYIEYYAVDDLGNNYSQPLNETVCVDNTPPESSVDIGTPKYYKDSESIWYVTSHTPIWINTSDDNACDSGCQYLHWEAYIYDGSSWVLCNISVWNGTGWENMSSGNETSNTLKFHFNEECHHKIVYYGVDNVGNVEATHEMEFKVDDSPPVIHTTYSGPAAYKVSRLYGPSIYVTSDTIIVLSPEDKGTCPVESTHILYNIKNNSGYYWATWQEVDNDTAYVSLPSNEGHYWLEYNVSDDLGNWNFYNDSIWIDNSPPVSEITPGNGSYVSTSTSLRIEANDMPSGDGAIGGITTDYRIYNGTAWTSWITTNPPIIFHFEEECTHYVEFRSYDALGNTEEIQNYTYYVDITPPTTTLDVGTPNQNHYVTSNTPIWLNASDAGCHGGAGVKELHYIVRVNNLTQVMEGNVSDGGAGDNNDTIGNISAVLYLPDMEECNFTIEYWSIDNVSGAGNEEHHHYEYFIVDNTPPEINLTIGEPQYDRDGKTFINFSTPIWVNASDGSEECDVGSVNLSVRVYWIMDGYNLVYHTWDNVTNGWAHVGPFTIDEECVHWINITAVDDLGNVAYLNKTVYVDNSPPVLHKEVGNPKYPEKIIDENFDNGIPSDWATHSGVYYRNGYVEIYSGGSSYSSIMTPVFSLDGVTSATLTFKAALAFEGGGYNEAAVYISTNGGSTWQVLGNKYTTAFNWQTLQLNLTPYAGETNLRLQFYAYRYANFSIDDVVVVGSYPPIEINYITSQTPIYLNFTDTGFAPECTVGSLHVNVSVYSFLTGNTTYYEWDNLSADAKLNETIYLPDECMNWVNITYWDNLGNVAWDNETFYVDNSPPIGYVKAIAPNHQDAPIIVSVNVSDYPVCSPSGIKNVTLYYRYAPYNHSFGAWMVYGTLTAPSWNWTFDAPNGTGYYQFCSIAYDNLGHIENKTLHPEAWVCVPYSDFEFHLVKGWNLITVPVKSNLNASMLARAIGDECEIIVRYDSVNQKFVDYVVGINAPNNKDFDIVSGMGYFVGLSNGKDITIAEMRAVVGDENLTGCLLENISIELHPGENLIGWCNLVDTTASCVAEYFNDTHNFGDAYHQITLTNWSKDIQQFGEGYPIDLPPEYGFDITFGDAFFIFVPGDETVMWYGGDRLNGCGLG